MYSRKKKERECHRGQLEIVHVVCITIENSWITYYEDNVVHTEVLLDFYF